MTALVKVEQMPCQAPFDQNQINLLKTTICKGSSDEELKFFIYACQRTGLDPFARQIYSVPRGGQRVIQTSVDGFRLIAERTGRYSPGKEPTYCYDKNGALISATAYVKKQTKDGTWHEVAASAMMSEYDGKNNFWKKMPHLMLSKCAECLALRKAFPAEMSGLYGQEEMQQAENDVKPLYMDEQDVKPEKISVERALELNTILNSCSKTVKENFMKYLKMKFKVELIDELPAHEYEKHRDLLIARAKEYAKEKAEEYARVSGGDVQEAVEIGEET